jgi:hypothetical protein
VNGGEFLAHGIGGRLRRPNSDEPAQRLQQQLVRLPGGGRVTGQQRLAGPLRQLVELDRPGLVAEGTVVAVITIEPVPVGVHTILDVVDEPGDVGDQRRVGSAGGRQGTRCGRLEDGQEPGAFGSRQPGRVREQDLP